MQVRKISDHAISVTAGVVVFLAYLIMSEASIDKPEQKKNPEEDLVQMVEFALKNIFFSLIIKSNSKCLGQL